MEVSRSTEMFVLRDENGAFADQAEGRNCL